MLADARVEQVAVVEVEEAMVGWMRDGTIPHGPGYLADERVHVVETDVAVAVAEARRRRTTWCCSTSTTGPTTSCTTPTRALYNRDVPPRRAAALRPGGAW